MRSSIRSLCQAFGRASFGTVLLVVPASASDLGPYVVPTLWSGFYIGGQLGGAWSESDWRFENHNYWNTLGPRLLGTDFDIDATGVAGGRGVRDRRRRGNADRRRGYRDPIRDGAAQLSFWRPALAFLLVFPARRYVPHLLRGYGNGYAK